MEDELYTLLSQYECFRQGSVGTYPNLFITLWNNESVDKKHYDNSRLYVLYDYDLNVYGKNVQAVYDALDNCISILKNAGWSISGNGNDIPSDDANYIGRGVNIKYLKMEEQV